MIHTYYRQLSHLLIFALLSCTATQSPDMPKEKTYQEDLDFLKKHQTVLELKAPDNEDARLLLVAAYQARVMTSTGTGLAGSSYGWLNYDLIKSGEITPHINPVGGEERFWLAPEGGQYSIFFKPEASFEFDQWQTPALIDTETFELASHTASQAVFSKEANLVNYSGTTFSIGIKRKISVLDKNMIENTLGIPVPESLSCIAYQSENTLTNLGEDWNKENGTLGIWILGMFKPSDQTTMIAPFAATEQLMLTDDYFGKVPKDRLRKTEAAIFFKGDGHHRSKIGLAPPSAKPVAGAWDAEKGILTLVQYDLDPQGDYLASTWEIHENPYAGDAFNAYNDGPVDDGSQLGPFIELESTSPTKALKKDESIEHLHRTFHFEGDRQAMNAIALKVLGVGLSEIEKGF